MSLERWPFTNLEPQDQQHEIFSIAVSLKRIADTLQYFSLQYFGEQMDKAEREEREGRER